MLPTAQKAERILEAFVQDSDMHFGPLAPGYKYPTRLYRGETYAEVFAFDWGVFVDNVHEAVNDRKSWYLAG
jgi:hypothetical protein